MKAPSFILNFFELIPYNFIFSPSKSIRNNQNSCYPRSCQWILRVCRNPTTIAKRVENPSMTLSAYLMLLLLCVLDKERGVHFLRKKTRCVYKCCHWRVLLFWFTSSDWVTWKQKCQSSPRLQHPLETRTEVGSFQHCHCPEQHSDKIKLLEVTFRFYLVWLVFFKYNTCKTFVLQNVSALLL